jgi:methylamine---glutamate N-methyltransferase subunit A
MCGVVGLLIKDPALEPVLGEMLEPMIGALADRGPDSSGLAVYSRSGTGDHSPLDGPAPVRISVGSDATVPWPRVCAEVGDRFGRAVTVRPFPRGAVIETPAHLAAEVQAFVDDRWPAVRVVATGAAAVVVKDIGRPEETCRSIGLAHWPGYLAVAHTRMATESAVTLLHAHPFAPTPDLCVVHNGSFSNYASVRRSLQARGVVFESDNDSEVAARLLAERLSSGDDLEESTRWVTKELDGFFTLVITTATAMSVVRDPFACKPAVVAETPRYVAVASEYRALAHLPDIAAATVFEPRPEEVYTWTC